MKIFSNLVNHLKNRKITNLFKTNFNKNVLISYTVYPIRFTDFLSHNNAQEILSIAKTFKMLGYNVDLVHYLSKEKINYKKYRVIFGFGDPMSESFKYNNISKRIYYGTGAHPYFQNYQTLKMANEFYIKNNKWLIESTRVVKYTWPEQLQIVDSIILLGNKYIKETYSKYFNEAKIELIDSTYNKNLIDIKVNKEKNNSYLYFSSNGAIHRGLDKLLEIFKDNNSINLYIATNLEKEKGFYNHYKEYFSKRNIFYKGFVKINSKEFLDLINECSFAILPTCSEGQSTSLLNLMYYGLVPITTRYSGLNTDYIEIKDTNIESIKESIKTSILMKNDQYKEISNKVKSYTLKNSSIKNYENKIYIIIKKILKNE